MEGITRRTFLASSTLASARVFLRGSLLPGRKLSGDWTSHGWDIGQTRFNRGESVIGPGNVSGLQLRWEFEARGGITGTPAIAGDRVIFGSWDGHVYAVDRRTGKPLWTYEVGIRDYPPDRQLGIFASPAIEGHFVYVVADRIVALHLESGRLLWERFLGDPEKTHEYFWASPLVHAGRLYVGVSAGTETQTRGRLVCLDAATGRVNWTFFTVAPDVAGGALIAPPSLDARGETLYAATGSPFHVRPGRLRHSCSLIALNPVNGALRWADQVIPHDTRNLDLNCPPMLVSAMRSNSRLPLIVVGGKDGIRAWNRNTRSRIWHTQITPSLPPNGEEALPTTGPESGPTAAAGGLVFFASNHHPDKSCVIAALDAAAGEIRWLHCLPAFEFSSISVANGVAYLGLVDGKLRAWRATDGELLWESPQGQPIACGPAIAHGMVFVGAGAGNYLPGNKLRAFGLK